ncbi:MaoC/PaaZ C-terminal domain-containing protein [Cryptosporangium sp. NPDC051539]|uniref:MaoC/PaaZ C-terminal domain-containing protein n=1 Tax=Cryptosporangium sp. NPDC051539 TaxID=3363962 RepID=UPI0037A7EE39
MSTEPTVGARIGPLTLPPISRTTLALFAGASHDHNPIHIDVDAARLAGFDDVIAHGMLSMAYLGRVLTGWRSQAQLLSWRVRFTAMTPVLSVPICQGVMTAVSGGVAELDLVVRLDDGTVTLSGSARVRVE